MNDDNNFEDDPALAAAMGFSSFGQQPTTKKRKDRSDLDAVVYQGPESDASASKSDKTQGHVRRGGYGRKGMKLAYGSTASAAAGPRGATSGNAEGSFDGADARKKKDNSGRGYIEKELQQMTRDDLDALRMGIRNKQGDKIYFLPSFVEDPWTKLLNNNGEGQAMKR